MLEENSVLEDRNQRIFLLIFFVISIFQNRYFGTLSKQNKELINLNKEVLSSYEYLIDNHIKYSEDVRYMKAAGEYLEKQNRELMEKAERLNKLFFN